MLVSVPRLIKSGSAKVCRMRFLCHHSPRALVSPYIFCSRIELSGKTEFGSLNDSSISGGTRIANASAHSLQMFPPPSTDFEQAKRNAT